MRLHIAVDIGCLECGEESALLGAFTDLGQANAVAAENADRQRESWHGQHSFRVFTVTVDEVYPGDYRSWSERLDEES